MLQLVFIIHRGTYHVWIRSIRRHRCCGRFNDGNELVRQIKDKRKAINAPLPPPYLEESLKLGPVNIEAQRDSGLNDFGDDFANGDRKSMRSVSVTQALMI